MWDHDTEPIRSRIPLRRFRYDPRHDSLKCPKGRILRPTRRVEHGRFFYSKAKDCRRCLMRGDSLSPGRVNKAVIVSDDHPALVRARRRRERWSDEDARLYRRHRWRSKGFAALLDDAEAEVLAYMRFPAQHRAKFHSTNSLERLNGEVKCRSEVVGIFPNEAAVIRIIDALLLERNDEWAVQRALHMILETIAPLSDDRLISLSPGVG